MGRVKGRAPFLQLRNNKAECTRFSTKENIVRRGPCDTASEHAGGVGASNRRFLPHHLSSEGQLRGNRTCFPTMQHVVPTLALLGRSESTGLSRGALQVSVGMGGLTA